MFLYSRSTATVAKKCGKAIFYCNHRYYVESHARDGKPPIILLAGIIGGLFLYSRSTATVAKKCGKAIFYCNHRYYVESHARDGKPPIILLAGIIGGLFLYSRSTATVARKCGKAIISCNTSLLYGIASLLYGIASLRIFATHRCELLYIFINVCYNPFMCLHIKE